MKTRSLCDLCSIVTAALILASPSHASVPKTSLALTTYVGSAMYTLTVEPAPGKASDDDLRIVCVFNCVSNVNFVETIPSSPILGAYPIEDGILTLWAVGDGSLVRVYHIDSSGVRKVLETPTRGQYPVLASAKNGRPAIIIQGKTAGDLQRDQEKGIKENSYPVQGDLWIWNGREYAISKGSGVK